MSFAATVQSLNKNKYFKFTSSVKLAIPLMLALAACVAYGTIIESNYNSEYAKIAIYNTTWFTGFLGLLWLNIFNATLSRYPFRKHHTGFVITHIGLLTFLIGAMITAHWGIDGQLRVTEGQASSQIVLPQLMVSYQLEGSPTPQSLSFEKTLTEKTGSDLSFLNDSFSHLFTTVKMLPFAKLEKNYLRTNPESSDAALSFILKSQFFQVNEWLHTRDNAEMKMGPATLRIRIDADGSIHPRKISSARQEAPRAKKVAHTAGSRLIIRNAANKSLLKDISLADLRKGSVTVQGIKIGLKNVYQRAIVAQNKLEEGPVEPGKENPALELTLESKGQIKREVTYAKFPNFSMSKDGNYGLNFEYQAGKEMGSEIDGPTKDPGIESEAAIPDSTMSKPGDRTGNVIEFHLNKKSPKEARVELYKNDKFVAAESLSEGQTFQTPWMGMKISLGTLVWGSEPASEAEAVVPDKGMPLPPSAIAIRMPGESRDIWLTEGEVQSLQSHGRNFEVFFGRQTMNLPFALKLNKFTKEDYPGTETPLSYESDVEIPEAGLIQKISMNEPLKHLGYTIYQASYVINPGAPPDSIFSVNQDPGRPIKYLGSLILALGIITFTLMRSRVWKKYVELKKGQS